jgi:hypothetical protein
MSNNYVNENQKSSEVIEKQSNERSLNAGKSSNGDKVYFELLRNMKAKKFDDFEDYSTVFMTF